MIERLIAWLADRFKWDEEVPHVLYIPEAPKTQILPVQQPLTPTPSMPPLTNEEKLYREAKVCLGYPQKLDPSVPNLVACASSLSGVLKKAGFIGLPPLGIAGTFELYSFLRNSPQFVAVANGAAGDIIISQSGVAGAKLAHGHVGILGNNGIMSNDSDTGLWREVWTLPKWTDYYHTYGRLPITFFRWKG